MYSDYGSEMGNTMDLQMNVPLSNNSSTIKVSPPHSDYTRSLGKKERIARRKKSIRYSIAHRGESATFHSPFCDSTKQDVVL